MNPAPNRASFAGTAYLALRKLAREQGRATDELLQLYALEAFVDRLASSAWARDLVLKGGVLLAAYDTRRPTRDVDLSAQSLANDPAAVAMVIESILALARDGGSRGVRCRGAGTSEGCRGRVRRIACREHIGGCDEIGFGALIRGGAATRVVLQREAVDVDGADREHLVGEARRSHAPRAGAEIACRGYHDRARVEGRVRSRRDPTGYAARVLVLVDDYTVERSDSSLVAAHCRRDIHGAAEARFPAVPPRTTGYARAPL